MSTQTAEKEATILVMEINIRPATKDDLTEEWLLKPVPKKHRAQRRLRYGQPYFVRSQRTGKVDAGVKILNGETNKDELLEYFKNKMIYVPCGYFDTPAMELL